MEIRVEVADRLHEHVLFETEMSGLYTDAGDYLRDLIRRDMERADHERELVKTHLQQAFASPKGEAVAFDADAFRKRMHIRHG